MRTGNDFTRQSQHEHVCFEHQHHNYVVHVWNQGQGQSFLEVNQTYSYAWELILTIFKCFNLFYDFFCGHTFECKLSANLATCMSCFWSMASAWINPVYISDYGKSILAILSFFGVRLVVFLCNRNLKKGYRSSPVILLKCFSSLESLSFSCIF